MRKALPLWVCAVVPATLLGHAVAYALDGRTMADGRHAWLAPIFEASLAALILVCTLLLGSTLLRARLLVSTKIEQSFYQLCPRLAIAQVILFGAIESAEGLHVTLWGLVAQLAIAVCAAYLLSLFTHLLARCAAGTTQVSRYLHRLLCENSIFLRREPTPRAITLFACAGPNSFQRPPPHRS